MAMQTTLMTADELLLLPEDDARFELINGELIEMSPDNFSEHGWVVDTLHVAMSNHARATGAGKVVANVGFRLHTDPDTVLAPDIAYIPRDRAIAARQHRGYARTWPEIAVEVLSPANSSSEMQRKIRLYLAAGVQLVWSVDPADRSVLVYAANGSMRLLSGDDVLDGGEVLPGFAISLPDLFA